MQVAVSDPGVGTTSSLEAVFREHHARVFRAAYRITGNTQDAEDVVQTVFLRLAGRGHSLDNPGSYLYRAALNSALDLLRARRPRVNVPLEEAQHVADSARPDPQRTQEAAEVRAFLRRALAELPERWALVFALRYLEEQDNREIARLLGTSRLNVAVTLHRARHRLQAALRDWKEGRS